LLTFNFNKKGKPKYKWGEYNDKKIFDCVVWGGSEKTTKSKKEKKPNNIIKIR
jgi:hypothetical protein